MTEVNTAEKKSFKRTIHKSGSSGAVYGFGLIGALIYYLSTLSGTNPERPATQQWWDANKIIYFISTARSSNNSYCRGVDRQGDGTERKWQHLRV